MNELTKTECSHTQLATPSPLMGQMAINIATSLNPTVPRERHSLASALLGEDGRIAELHTQFIDVVHYVVHDYPAVAEDTGEEINRLRIVLIDKNGLRFASGSKWILDSLRKLIFIRGNAPWDPPLRVIPTLQKSQKGRTFHILNIDPVQPTA